MDEDGGAKFPWCTRGSGGEAMGPQWYDEKAGVKAESVSFASKQITLSSGVTLSYKTLLIATGVRARVIDGIRSGSTWSECHSGDINPDTMSIVDPRRYGFGSTHTVRDMGDALKLVEAFSRIEDDSQKTCYDPIVVVGGGFIAMELAAAISMYSEDNHVTVVMKGEHFLEGVFNKEMSEFYERHLSQKFGVRFARNFRVTDLWSTASSGAYCSLDGPAMDLHKTRERVFEPTPSQFTECRGVILEDVNNPSDSDIRLPARFVVFGVGSEPNTEWLGGGLEMTAGGYVKVNENCETSEEGVYAIGDVAVVDRGGELERTGHVDAARKMARHVAKVARGEFVESGGMDHIPYFYSRVLDLSWKFWGSSECHEIVTIGLGKAGKDEGAEGKTWAAFYLRDGIIVGVLLNGGSDEQNAKLEGVIRAEAKVASGKKLAKCSIDEILKDPHLLTPPTLGLGEFHAETDPDEVREAFSAFEDESGSGLMKSEDLESLMKMLGADWDKEELADAVTALDEEGKGVVDLESFVGWWCN